MKAYNGFTPYQRQQAGAWIRAQIAAGRQPPTTCCACGQDAGVIDNHQEDYSKPYGEHLFRFPLCYLCHMMLHCRHRGPDAWDSYRAHVRDRELAAVPFSTRDWGRLQGYVAGRPVDYRRRAGWAGSTVLDEIHRGEHVPKC